MISDKMLLVCRVMGQILAKFTVQSMQFSCESNSSQGEVLFNNSKVIRKYELKSILLKNVKKTMQNAKVQIVTQYSVIYILLTQILLSLSQRPGSSGVQLYELQCIRLVVASGWCKLAIVVRPGSGHRDNVSVWRWEEIILTCSHFSLAILLQNIPTMQ